MVRRYYRKNREQTITYQNLQHNEYLLWYNALPEERRDK